MRGMPKPKAITAEQLKTIRKGMGKTQAQFAEALGIGLRTYVRFEKGQRHIPLLLAFAARCLEKKS